MYDLRYIRVVFSSHILLHHSIRSSIVLRWIHISLGLVMTDGSTAQLCYVTECRRAIFIHFVRASCFFFRHFPCQLNRCWLQASGKWENIDGSASKKSAIGGQRRIDSTEYTTFHRGCLTASRRWIYSKKTLFIHLIPLTDSRQFMSCKLPKSTSRSTWLLAFEFE